jgi:hypothetical protein
VIVAVGHCDPAASLDTLLSRDIQPTENGSPRAQANVPVQPILKVWTSVQLGGLEGTGALEED